MERDYKAGLKAGMLPIITNLVSSFIKENLKRKTIATVNKKKSDKMLKVWHDNFSIQQNN